MIRPMRTTPLKTATALTLLLASAAVTGCSSGSGDGTSPDGTAYAPYVIATSPAPADTTGSPDVHNLAFVVAGGDSCVPTWDASRPVDAPEVKARIKKLKASGGDVRVSFGGAEGTDLADVCHSPADLAKAYGDALDAAGTTLADFDVEGDDLRDSRTVDLRSQAIALLQKEREDLEVTFTLPVMPDGLDASGLALLDSANEHDVQVSTVNIMVMNYGESYTGDMGDYAVTSAESVHSHLKKVFGLSDATAWQGMALTSMIGVNDIAQETFTLDNARHVRDFAEEKGIAWVSQWTTYRDRPCEGNDPERDNPSANCSGVREPAGAFAKTLAGS